MLFKTRVGLCVLNKNIEIRAFFPPNSKIWSICTQHRSGPEMESKSLFGRSVKFSGGNWFTLAAFMNHESVDTEIGKAMQIIADAYANSAPICDLSNVGSVEAWRQNSERWSIVRWP